MSQAITELVKNAVKEVDPSAEVILFGSKARGSDTRDSDWDFLVLTAKKADRETKQLIRRKMYEIEWSTGQVISSLIKDKAEWNRPLLISSPFHRNVEKEGIHL